MSYYYNKSETDLRKEKYYLPDQSCELTVSLLSWLSFGAHEIIHKWFSDLYTEILSSICSILCTVLDLFSGVHRIFGFLSTKCRFIFRYGFSARAKRYIFHEYSERLKEIRLTARTLCHFGVIFDISCRQWAHTNAQSEQKIRNARPMHALAKACAMCTQP